jgi:hypothetical protein
MLEHTVGEWILSTITTSDRAASIVGDLIQARTNSIRFWMAIGSNVLHAITPRVVGAAVVGLLAQFVVLAIPSITIILLLRSSGFSIYVWHWFAVLSGLGTQILTGLWIGRSRQKQPLLVCLLVVVVDCVLGLLKVNNASVNMAIWSIPLLLGTIAMHRKHWRRAFQ